jgi:hypothetical protein
MSSSRAAWRWGGEIGGQVFGIDRTARWAHGHRALNLVSQLPHVAGPPVPGEQIEGRRTQMDVRLAEPLAGIAQRSTCSGAESPPPFAQRRDVDRITQRR